MSIVAENTIAVVASLISALAPLTVGIGWALVLRGPYWLFKLFRGEPIAFWWPWGVVIAGLTGGLSFLGYLLGYND